MARRRSSTSGQHRVAVLSEISNDLETERAYLNLDARRPLRNPRRHLMTRASSMAAYDERVSQPLDAVIQRRLNELRVASTAYLDSVLS